MRDAPDTADLVETAREALKAEILPGLSGESAYAGAMIASAMGIALRDLSAAGDETAEAERAALRRLLGSEESDLRALNADLAAAIREGRFDAGTEAHGAARRLLWSQAIDRLARVNPKQLAREREAGTLPPDVAPEGGGE